MAWEAAHSNKMVTGHTFVRKTAVNAYWFTAVFYAKAVYGIFCQEGLKRMVDSLAIMRDSNSYIHGSVPLFI